MEQRHYRQQIETAFNGFNGRNLDFLDGFYAKDVVFQDPVTRINGLESLKKYYAHAYQNVETIRFEFGELLIEDRRVVAPWVMHLQVNRLNGGKSFPVEGLSYFEFDDKNLVRYHRDYVDLGAMVYERLPVLGSMVRLIKRQLGG